MTSLPLDFPALREMAMERMAEVARVSSATTRPGRPRAWGWLRDAEAAILSDLTQPAPQALWLRWLAGQLGGPLPSVGCPGWVRSLARNGAPETYAGCPMFLLGASGHGFGFIFGWTGKPWGPRMSICPALPNPDDDTADVRALVLAVVTVAKGVS